MGRTPRGETRERIFDFVRSRLMAGEPPTVRDVQRRFGFRAVQSARQHLEALVEEGRLEVARGRSRGYHLPAGEGGPREIGSGERGTERGGGGIPEADGFDGPVYSVPVVGRVAAGPLSTAFEELEGLIPVQGRYEPGELFALRVRGDSMIGAGILPGDLVIVHRQPDAENGDIVVALVGDEATVKRLKKGRARVELHAENPLYEPIVPSVSDVRVLGKVIEVRRLLVR